MCSSCFIDRIHPNIVVSFASEYLICLVAIRHTQLKRIVFILLFVVSTVLEVAIEDVTTGIDLAICSRNGRVMLPSCQIDDAITILQPIEIVLDLEELLGVQVSLHARPVHVFAVLAIEEHLSFLSQNHAEELPVGDLLVVAAVFRLLNSSQTAIISALPLGSVPNAPNGIVRANIDCSLVARVDLSHGALGSIF